MNAIPDFDWYASKSKKFRLPTPRCPFANVNKCPRYYWSLSLLGNAGFTSVKKAEDERLEKLWEGSQLVPRTSEQRLEHDLAPKPDFSRIVLQLFQSWRGARSSNPGWDRRP